MRLVFILKNDLYMDKTKIFSEAFGVLREYYGNVWGKLRVTKINLQYLYTVIELNNGEIGVAMNYANAGFSNSKNVFAAQKDSTYLLNQTKKDALLINTLLDGCYAKKLSLSHQSVLCAIFSALCRRLYDSSTLNIKTGSINLNELARNNDKISIIGFGGYMEQALRSDKFSHVFIADLLYSELEGKNMLDARIEKYKTYPENKQVVLHDGVNNNLFIEKSDIVCVTGSALCNGTMQELLEASRSCRSVIVSGHSGLLPPTIYFGYGVTHIGWSSIPTGFMHLLEEYNETLKPFDHFIDNALQPKYYVECSETYA